MLGSLKVLFSSHLQHAHTAKEGIVMVPFSSLLQPTHTSKDNCQIPIKVTQIAHQIFYCLYGKKNSFLLSTS